MMGTKNNPGEFDCYTAADPDEEVFILLARDVDAPARVRDWANRRELKLAQATGVPAYAMQAAKRKIAEARACADRMEAQYPEIKAALQAGLSLAKYRKTRIG